MSPLLLTSLYFSSKMDLRISLFDDALQCTLAQARSLRKVLITDWEICGFVNC